MTSTPLQDEELKELLHELYNSGWVEGNDYAEKTHDGRVVSEPVITERENRKVENIAKALKARDQRLETEARQSEKAWGYRNVRNVQQGTRSIEDAVYLAKSRYDRGQHLKEKGKA